jgi:hypothetical protein
MLNDIGVSFAGARQREQYRSSSSRFKKENATRGGDVMQLYIFKSDAKSDLRAFAGDVTGSKLPDKFRPWHAIGIVAPEKAPPHGLARKDIEQAIGTHGFQLWRLRKPMGENNSTRVGEPE